MPDDRVILETANGKAVLNADGSVSIRNFDHGKEGTAIRFCMDLARELARLNGAAVKKKRLTRVKRCPKRWN